jgi:competence protein ComEC
MNLRLFLIYALVGVVVLSRIVLTKPAEELPDQAKITATVRLLSTPQTSFGRMTLPVMVRGNKVSLIVPAYSNYQYGDLLRISGTIQAKVLDDKRIVYSIYFPKIEKTQDGSGFLFQAAGWVRERVTRAFDLYLPSDQSSLLLGVVFGISSTISQDLKQNFQVAGVTHVVAASGMNVTLLAGFLLPIFLHFFKRQQGLILTIVCLCFYTIISGMSASIVRATLMASIGYIGLILGRQRTAFISFFLTGSLMVLWNPTVISDIGFQLSFAATSGMLLVRPLLPSLAKIPLLQLVEEDLTATISAQITTLPILIFYFHSFGVLAILVNTLVLWTIPPLMVVGSLASVVALVSIQLGGLISFICLPLLSYFLIVIKEFAGITPIITLQELPLSLIGGYYLIVGGVVIWLYKRKTHKHITP